MNTYTKAIFFSLFIFLFLDIGNLQGVRYLNTNLNTVNNYAEIGSDLLKSNIPASPTAASLGQYGEVPVSLHTGVPNISIPLFNLSGNQANLPVGLSYHPTIKVEQLASSVGLGWSLNAGGVITRQIRDEPDDAYRIKERLACFRCNDCFNCDTCETFTDSDLECVTCSDQGKSCYEVINTSTLGDVGYLYNGGQVANLYNKNTYSSDEKEFLYGNPLFLEQNLTYENILEKDIVVSMNIREPDPNDDCKNILEQYLRGFSEEDIQKAGIAATIIYALNGGNGPNAPVGGPTTIVVAILTTLFNDIIDQYGFDANNLPYLDFQEIENLPGFARDCLRFTVLRPKYDVKDTEPDIFNFNFNGYSGQFVFDSQGEVKIFSDQDLKIEYKDPTGQSFLDPNFDIDVASGYPNQLESIYQGGITQFEITTPDGMRYVFAEKEISLGNNAGQNLSGNNYQTYSDCAPPLARPYHFDLKKARAAVSSWYLTAVYNALGQQEFQLSYKSALTMNHGDISQTLSLSKDDMANVTSHVSINSNVSLVFGKQLEEITWRNGTSFGTTGKLKFNYIFNRPDLYYPFELFNNLNGVNKNKLLNSIHWLDSNGRLIRQVAFDYDEFSETPLSNCNNQPPWMEAHRSRIRLKKVAESGLHPQEVGTLTTKPPYVFSYNNTPLPPRHSAQQDLWGYYSSGVQTLIPKIHAYEFDDANNELNGSIYSVFPRNSFVGNDLIVNNFIGAERAFNEADAQAGILESITYPTGGKVHFEYEGHTATTRNISIPNGKGGGLRIKKVYADLGDNQEQLVKNYRYTKKVGNFDVSTGQLISLPEFTKANSNDDPSVVTIFSRAQAGLETSNGSHVVYEVVTEDLGDRGSTVNTFDVAVDYETQEVECIGNDCIYTRSDGSSSSTNNTYLDNFPHPPHPNMDWYQGILLEQKMYSTEGVLVQTTKYDYQIFDYLKIPAIRTNTQSEDVFRNIIQHNSIGKYYLLSGDKRLQKQTTTTHYDTGDISQTVEYEYNGIDHRNPTATITTNSDGKIHRTETDYAEEANVTCLLDKHIISAPVETRYFVDGKFQGGQKTEYFAFTAQQCLPKEVKALLYTGTSTVGSELNRFTIAAYTPDGFQESVQQRGFPAHIFEWQEGLLDKVTYDNQIRTYEYTPDSRLLHYIKDIDGQETHIKYDGLQRTEQITTRGGAVTTDFTYTYGIPNKVITALTFADNTPDQISEQILDPLGRVTRERLNGVSKNEVKYDLFGRVEQQTYLPGNFKTLVYDNSPLNRLIEEIYPDGNSTQTQYESENSYYKTTVTDENGHATSMLTDLLGRTFKRVDALNGETIWYYDDRNNVTDILSPLAGGDINQTDLNYHFTYDNRSRRTSEQIPGAGTKTITYDDNTDLLRSILDANGNTQIFNYDNLGRETSLQVNGQLTRSYRYDNNGVSPTPINIGRMNQSRTRILETGNFITTNYTYDSYGRVAQTTTNNHLLNNNGQELLVNTYNDADWMIQVTRQHTGNQNLAIIQDYQYDRFGREILADYSIQELTTQNITSTTLREQTWNDRDQLVRKVLGGGLQSLDYLYNERGWLRHINQPLDLYQNNPQNAPICATTGGAAQFNTTTLPPFEFCSEEEVNLEWLLTVRFQANIAVNCYEPCPLMGGIENPDCPTTATDAETGLQNALQAMRTAYAHAENIPCATGGTETIYRPDLQASDFPTQLHRIRLCNGTEAYVLANQLSHLQNGSYTIIQTVDLYDINQPLDVSDDCGELGSSNLDDLFTQILAGTIDNQFTTEDYILNDGQCEPLLPACSTEQITEQQAALQALVEERKELEDLNFPTNLYRVILCDGTETYLFEEELANFPGSYGTLQDIFIPTANTTVQLGITFNGTDIGDIFRLSLYYDENIAGGTAQKNGNIAAMAWQTAGRQAMAYGFRYDGLDRLTRASYSDIEDDGNVRNNNRYGTNYSYDANGNIKTLTRFGYSTSNSSNGSCGNIIDLLTYRYTNNNQSNQLQHVFDSALEFNKGFNPGPAGAGTNTAFSYSYDNNGNLTTDPYKQYTASYNFLNLPTNFTFSGINSGTISYLYDADGVKLTKTVGSDTKDYCKGIEYNNNTLEAVYNSEGRAISTGAGGFQLEYYIKDHLGNTRVIFSDLDNDGKIEVDPSSGNSELLSSTDYYPFGMAMEGSWDMQTSPQNDYLYNGKELDKELGLNLQHYGARLYDNVLGRFTGVDPLAKKFGAWSPYNYVLANPVRFIDPDGRYPILPVIGAWIKRKLIWEGVKQVGRHIFTPAKPPGGKVRPIEAAPPGTTQVDRTVTVANELARQAEVMEGFNSGTNDISSNVTTDTGGMGDEAIVNSISVKDKTPQEGESFGSFGYDITNGKIELNGRSVTHGRFDFVVNEKGNLSIGYGHYNLSGGAETVKGAGRIKVYNGQITTIDNNSGHYKPTITEAQDFPNLLQEKGLNVSGAKLKLYNEDGSHAKTTRIE